MVCQTVGVALPHRRRRLLVVIGAVVVAVIGLSILLAVSWLGTYRQAQALQSEVTQMRSALSSQNWTVAASHLPTALTAAQDLEASTDGLPWRVLEALPVVGNDASAVADVASAASSLLAAAEPLAPYAERISQIRREDGAIDLEVVSAIAPLLSDLAGVLQLEDFRLQQIDASQLRPQIADPLVELRDQLHGAGSTAATAAELAEHAPSLLGADGERTWLVLLQNPAEARGTGGFPGGYVTVVAKDGKLSIGAAGKSNDLQSVPIPTGGAPEDARVLWGNYLESWNTFNLSADFPMVAGLAKAGMDVRGQPVDGVIAVDPRAVAAILAVTGPVTVDDQTVTADNAESFFTVDVYDVFPDSNVRDPFVLKLVGEILQRFLSTAWNPVALADALSGPVSDGRVRVWSADPDEEAWLSTTAVGGGVPNIPGSVVAVAFDNAAGNKMDAFVATGVDYKPGRCPTSDIQQSSMSVSLRNDAPQDLPLESGNYGRADDPSAPAGSTKMLVYVYAPVGATFGQATIDGVPFEMFSGTERNRPVWWNYVTIDRGQERVIDISFAEPSVLDVAPAVIPQAMVKDEVVTIEPETACK